ncbi:MAG TPA: PspC domain-containing protein [Flexilinea sp.]|nr:PspC domain-containing protein [Flexilinea sp.]
MEHKKLYRSQKDRFIAGVCGGLAKYFGIDATIIRVAWIVLIFTTGFIPFVLIYILCALIIPLEPTSPKDVTIDQ